MRQINLEYKCTYHTYISTDNYTLLPSKIVIAVFEQTSPWQRDFQAGKCETQKVWRHVSSPPRPWSGCCVCQETHRALTPARAPDQTDSVTPRFSSSCQTKRKKKKKNVITHTSRDDRNYGNEMPLRTEKTCHDNTPCSCEIQRGEICAPVVLFLLQMTCSCRLCTAKLLETVVSVCAKEWGSCGEREIIIYLEALQEAKRFTVLPVCGHNKHLH